MHYYWRHPGNGMRFGSRHHNAVTGKGFMDFPHLDFKGDGGYVVIPPSISRKDGGDFEYRSILTDVIGWIIERTTGRRFDEVLRAHGVTDLGPYAVIPGNNKFLPDFFLD